MMQESSPDAAAQATADLLNRYGFDLGTFNADQLIGFWLHSYPLSWVRSAVVEALYQGRYKSISVSQILAIWKRRGQPIYHYSFEFERMVCGNLARIPTVEVSPPASVRQSSEPSPDPSDADAPDMSVTPEEPPPAMDMPSITEAANPEHQELVWQVEEPPEVAETVDVAIAKDPDVTEEPPDQTVPKAEEIPEFTFISSDDWWERTNASRHPIHQFTPDLDPGSLDGRFYEKLKAVVHSPQN